MGNIFGKRVGGDQHRFVARNGRHRRKRVHALRAGDARHQLHGEKGHAASSEIGTLLRRRERLAKADDRLARTEQREIRPTSIRISAEGAYLSNEIGTGEECLAVYNLSAA